MALSIGTKVEWSDETGDVLPGFIAETYDATNRTYLVQTVNGRTVSVDADDIIPVDA